MKRSGFILIVLSLAISSGLIAACSGTPAISGLTVTTTSFPSGKVNTAYSATATSAGGVGPFTWSLSSGSLPLGLTLGSSTSNSVTISGTPTSTGLGTFTLKITDSTGVTATSGTLTIRISNLAISTSTPLPAGATGTAYSVQLQATGGTAPYQWALASGSTLPGGVTLSSSGLLSGTPTASGTSTFSIMVSDSENPPATTIQSFSLTIAGPTGLALLEGNYAFRLSGFNASGAVAVAGSFVADGSGHITSGVEDFNSIQGPPKNQTFTGTYTLGSDNRGTLIFSSLSGTPTYAFAINSAGAMARMVEFDTSGIRGSGEIQKQTVTTCGTDTISGTGSVGESYVFGVTGSQGAFTGVTQAGPAVLAGELTTVPPTGSGQSGSLTGEADVNIPGFTLSNPDGSTGAPLLSGTFKTTSQSAYCAMTLSPQQTTSSLKFDVYPVSGTSSTLTEAFLIETDTVQSAAPYLTSGRMLQQCIPSGNGCAISPFVGQTAGTFFTANSVGELTGQALDTGVTPNIYVPDDAIAELSGSGGVSFTMSAVENQAGTVLTYGSPFQASFNSIDTMGRVPTTLALPFAPVFYVIGTNEALCIGQINGNPFFGYFLPQSAGPFTADTIKGTFTEGTLLPSTNTVPDFSGVLTLDGVSSVLGTQDTSTSGSNTAAQAASGTYTNIKSATGAGTYQLTSPGVFTGSLFIVSPTEFFVVSTTAGDNNPVLIEVQN